MTDHYSHCTLCPFECGSDRKNGAFGRCGCDETMRIARIAPHYWEEPCLSGQGIEDPVKGSGTVFFVGCSLGCVFCQNQKISARGSKLGRAYSPKELAIEMLNLQKLGVHNINLVTASHFAPSVAVTLSLAKQEGLTVPVVYNCSGYESISSLKMFSGLIDVYMPDFKFFSSSLSRDYARCENYSTVTFEAIKEMHRQVGAPVYGSDGFMQRGVLVRHLVLPGSDGDSRRIISLLHNTFGRDGIALSVMSQYTPLSHCSDFPELTDKLSRAAYLRVVEHAQALGFERLYTQSEESADESFIPEFR